MFHLRDHTNGYCLLGISSNNTLETIEAIKDVWSQVHYGNAFDYFWIDTLYQQQFTKWLQYVRMVKGLALIAILIACIGLYGICKLIMDKRTKEIGIRKVNGANVPEILLITNRYFVQWIIISFLLAIPVASVTTHKWLENFVYKTNLSWWIFLVAGIVALGVAFITISWQSWKAATRNPIESLRYE